MALCRISFYFALALPGLFLTSEAAFAEEQTERLVGKLESAAACAARRTSGAKQSKCECSWSDADFDAAMEEIMQLPPDVFKPAAEQARARNAVVSRSLDPSHEKLCKYFGLMDIEKAVNKDRKKRFCADAPAQFKHESFQRSNTAWCNSWPPFLERQASDSDLEPAHRAYAAALLLAHSQMKPEFAAALREAEGIPVLARVPNEVACDMLVGARRQAGLNPQASAGELAKLAAEIEQALSKLEVNCTRPRAPAAHGRK